MAFALTRMSQNLETCVSKLILPAFDETCDWRYPAQVRGSAQYTFQDGVQEPGEHIFQVRGEERTWAFCTHSEDDALLWEAALVKAASAPTREAACGVEGAFDDILKMNTTSRRSSYASALSLKGESLAKAPLELDIGCGLEPISGATPSTTVQLRTPRPPMALKSVWLKAEFMGPASLPPLVLTLTSTRCGRHAAERGQHAAHLQAIGARGAHRPF